MRQFTSWQIPVKGSSVLALILTGLAVGGCGAKPNPVDVCKSLEAAGVAKAGTCKEDKPGMISARAQEMQSFELANVPGEGGQVLSFANADAYTATTTAFEKAAMLAGPHRYGSAKALIFVQMNAGASLEDGKKAKAVVDAL
jgi:hypothetical protein